MHTASLAPLRLLSGLFIVTLFFLGVYSVHASTASSVVATSTQTSSFAPPIMPKGLNCGMIVSDPNEKSVEKTLKKLSKEPAFVCLGNSIIKDHCKDAYALSRTTATSTTYNLLQVTKQNGTCTFQQQSRYADSMGSIYLSCPLSLFDTMIFKNHKRPASLTHYPGRYTVSVFFASGWMYTALSVEDTLQRSSKSLSVPGCTVTHS